MTDHPNIDKLEKLILALRAAGYSIHVNPCEHDADYYHWTVFRPDRVGEGSTLAEAMAGTNRNYLTIDEHISNIEGILA